MIKKFFSWLLRLLQPPWKYYAKELPELEEEITRVFPENVIPMQVKNENPLEQKADEALDWMVDHGWMEKGGDGDEDPWAITAYGHYQAAIQCSRDMEGRGLKLDTPEHAEAFGDCMMVFQAQPHMIFLLLTRKYLREQEGME